MIAQIAQFTDGEECKTNGRYEWVAFLSCGRRGDVDPVGHVDTGKEPVVGRILEDVHGGHGSSTKPVEEERFELTFCKVQANQDEGEALQI